MGEGGELELSDGIKTVNTRQNISVHQRTALRYIMHAGRQVALQVSARLELSEGRMMARMGKMSRPQAPIFVVALPPDMRSSGALFDC